MMKIGIIKKLSLVSAIVISAFSLVKAQDALQGIRAIEVEQYENAKKIFQSLIQNNPSDASNYFYLGKAYFAQEKMDSAKLSYEKGLQVNVSSSLNMVGLGSILYDAGNDVDAKAKFDAAIAASQGKDYRTLLYIGEAYTELGKKNFQEALANLGRAKVLDPKNPEVYVAIGDVYLQQNDGTNAVKFYNEALKLDPNYVKAYVRTGKLYTRALNYAEAKSAFEKAISIDPNYPPIYREYGELELFAKKYESAVEYYKKYMELTDKSLSSQLRYARFLFSGKRYDESVNLMKEIIPRDSSDYIIFRLLGYSSYEIKDYKTGLIAMNKFFSMNPRKILPTDYSYLGKLQVKNKQDSLGVSNIRKALDMDTTDKELYADLGEAYFSMKKYNESAMAYEKKIEGGKATAVDYFYIGRGYYFGKEYVKSDSAFSKLIVLKNDFVTAWIYRGRNNVALNPENTAVAKPYYEKAIELITTASSFDPKKMNRDLIEAYKYMGDYYFTVANDKATSKSYWEKVLEMDPNDKQAKDVLAGMKSK